MADYPALSKVLQFCIASDIPIPDDLKAELESIGIKTEVHYARVLSRGVRDLYSGRTTADDLLNTMVGLLDTQLRKAWNEGMRANGLDPATEMEPEWEDILQGIIDSEFEHVGQFINDVVAAAQNKEPIDPLISRAELWANRYNDVVNQAKLITAGAKDKLEWIYGDTDHCGTCEALNGLVATRSEWEQSNFHPQRPPNPMLECEGWRCQCRLEPTTKRKSPKVLDTLLNLGAASQI